MKRQQTRSKTKQSADQDRFYEALPGVSENRADYLDYEDAESETGLSIWAIIGIVILGLLIILLWVNRGLNFKNPTPAGGSTITSETEL